MLLLCDFFPLWPAGFLGAFSMMSSPWDLLRILSLFPSLLRVSTYLVGCGANLAEL